MDSHGLTTGFSFTSTFPHFRPVLYGSCPDAPFDFSAQTISAKNHVFALASRARFRERATVHREESSPVGRAGIEDDIFPLHFQVVERTLGDHRFENIPLT